jgi:acetyl-CoA acetyltransferase
VIVSHRDHEGAVDHPVAHVNAMGTALRGRPSWDQFDDLTTMACRDAAAQMWTRTDLTPADVQLAEMYDGFSFITMTWLEAMGFCGKGESGPFVEGGAAIARDGVLPLNTHGGQLSAGRLHGYGFLHEACLQLWGEAGERQVTVPAGGPPEVGIAAAGGGPLAASLLLTR